MPRTLRSATPLRRHSRSSGRAAPLAHGDRSRAFAVVRRARLRFRLSRLGRVVELGEPAYDRLEVLTERAFELHATTEAGFRVKARLLWHHLMMEHGPDGVFKAGDTSAEAAMSLASDMIGSART